MNHPLAPAQAKAAIRAILHDGNLAFSRHAQEEMRKDDLNDVDAVNVLRGGTVEPAEFENGSWRYRVRTSRMCFVVMFRSTSELRVVTGWRIKR